MSETTKLQAYSAFGIWCYAKFPRRMLTVT